MSLIEERAAIERRTMSDVPNKPMVPTAPASPAVNPLHPMPRHIGQPLGSIEER